MHPATRAFLLGLACLAVAIADRAATAQGYITVNQCDSTQVGGVPASQVAFSVVSPAGSEDILDVRMLIYSPQAPGDTCHVLLASAPPGWIPHTQQTGGAADGGADWTVDGPYPIVAGQVLAGFHVTLSRPTCCVEFQFSNQFEPFATTDVCFECPRSTPAKSSSWGTLKAHYR